MDSQFDSRITMTELPAILLRADAYLAPAWWAPWDARRLWTPRWGTPAPLWLAYRALLALYAVVVSSIGRAIFVGTSERYMAYLTYQSVWLTVCYLCCQAAVAACVAAWPSLRDALEPSAGTPAPHVTLSPLQRAAWVGLARATQLLWCIALPFEAAVVTMYWLLLATPEPDQLRTWSNMCVGGAAFSLSLSLSLSLSHANAPPPPPCSESHGIKLLLLLIDLLASAMVLPDVHGVVVAAAVAGYVITNAWVSLTQAPVYSILSWRTPYSAALVSGVVLYVALAFFAAAAVAHARDALACKVRGGGALFRDEGAGAPYRGPCACCCCCCRGRGGGGGGGGAPAGAGAAAALAIKAPEEGQEPAAAAAAQQ